MEIKKANGDKVPFEIKKLENSLRRSGASDATAERISKEISKTLYEGMPTKEIYRKAFALLKKEEHPQAARYHLKRGIQQLGPSGFPFEKYLSEILKFEGYKVQTDIMVAGDCVNHEIDVIAEKDNNHYMIECKFHGRSGYKCNVKIPLYIHSRFLDVEKQWKKKKGHDTKFHQGWVATNTKFTTDAIQYGKCAGMYLLSWDYPKNESLKERIDASGLHPVTCLTTLTSREKQALLDKLIVLCLDICKDENVLKKIGVKETRMKKVIAEAKALCKI
jgi:ATP cone domain-containing protein/AF1548-like protein